MPGDRVLVREKVSGFLDGLANRKGKVKRRCRTVLQARAEALPARLPAPGKCTSHLGFGLGPAQWNSSMDRNITLPGMGWTLGLLFRYLVRLAGLLPTVLDRVQGVHQPFRCLWSA